VNYPNATKEDYIKALLEVRNGSYFNNSKHPNNLLMLKAQCKAKNQIITATQLAHIIGSDKYQVANLAYGTLAHHISDALGYTPDTRQSDNKPMWWMALSSGNEASEETIDRHFEFVMHQGLKEALVEIKWCKT